jgi:tetratricopeptide (TPR) repeat protein
MGSYWQAVRDWGSARPRRVLLAVVLLLTALGWGGYALSRQLSAHHHLRQARATLDDGDYPAARAALRECLRVWPDDAETRLLLARAYWMDGNPTEADEHLRAFRAARGDPAQLALESQMRAAAAGNLDPVEAALRKHIEGQHPERRYILESLIRGYLVRQRAEDAERLAGVWIDESPDRWQPWLYRGIARSLLSHELLSTAHDQSKADFRRVLELKPDNDLALFLLGNAYIMSGQFREALPHLEHYRSLKPDDPQGASTLGGCYRSLGRVEEARALLDGWLAAHPGTADVFQVRGEVALDLGKPDEALDFFRRAQALAPSHEKIDYQLARALRALGRDEEAKGHEDRWRLRNQLTEIGQVAALEPQNVAARHEAGTIALRLGDEPAAMRWFAAALQIDPAHKPTHTALADHFRAEGNQEAAEFHRRLAGQSPK